MALEGTAARPIQRSRRNHVTSAVRGSRCGACLICGRLGAVFSGVLETWRDVPRFLRTWTAVLGSTLAGWASGADWGAGVGTGSGRCGAVQTIRAQPQTITTSTTYP